MSRNRSVVVVRRLRGLQPLTRTIDGSGRLGVGFGIAARLRSNTRGWAELSRSGTLNDAPLAGKLPLLRDG